MQSPKLASIQHATVVAMIVAITTLVIVLMLIDTITEESSGGVSRLECATSVRQQSLAKKYSVGAFAASIKCPASELKLKQYASEDQTKREAFNKIGNAMLSCWNDFQRGEAELFKEEKIYCNICSFIEFEESAKPKTYTGLNEYLATRPPGNSFINQLSAYQTDDFGELFDNPSKFNMDENLLDTRVDTKKLYSVIFVYAKGKGGLSQLLDYVRQVGSVKSIGTAALVGGFMTAFGGPFGSIIAGAVTGGVVGGVATLLAEYIDDGDAAWAATTMFTEYNVQRLQKLNCKDTRLELTNQP